jgi:hypothetical protein
MKKMIIRNTTSIIGVMSLHFFLNSFLVLQVSSRQFPCPSPTSPADLPEGDVRLFLLHDPPT